MGNWHDNSLSRIDPETNRVVGRRSRSGSAPATWWSALAASGPPATTAWTPRPEDVVVVRIDPQTNRAVETIAVGGHPIDVAATKDAIWGVGRRPRHGATDRRALTRLPDLVAFRSQAATMSWVVRVGRQEWAGCKCEGEIAFNPSGVTSGTSGRQERAAPVNQSREAHHPARPLHSPEGPYGEPFATAAQPECRTSRLRHSPIPDPAGRTMTVRICLKRSLWLVSAVLACLSPPATDPRPS